MALTKKIEKVEFVAMIQDYQKRCCVNGHWQRGQWTNDVCEIVFDRLDERDEEIDSLEEVTSSFNTCTVKEFEQYYAFGIARNFDKYTLTGEVTTETFQNQLDAELDNDETSMADLAVSFLGVERLNTWDHNSSLDQTLVWEGLDVF